MVIALAALVGAPTVRAGSADDDYVAFLTSQHVGERSQHHPTRSQFIQLGHAICSDLNSGITAQQEGEGLLKADVTVKDVAALMLGAVHFSCPSHEGELTGG